MLAQSIDLLSDFKNFLPWISFLAGIGGSFHCVGMCGGLVTATCSKGSDVFQYQIGRLIGYLSLGFLASAFGLLVDLKKNAPQISIFSGLFIGVLFIFWGLKSFQGKKAEMPVPRFLGKIYQRLWTRFVKGNQSFSRSFFVGLISLFLPCGLLYGVILGAIALNSNFEILLSLSFFWLGTVPSMIVAPSLIQKIIKPLKGKLPKTYALSLILIGLLTIGLRVGKLNSHVLSTDHSSQEKAHSCH